MNISSSYSNVGLCVGLRLAYVLAMVGLASTMTTSRYYTLHFYSDIFPSSYRSAAFVPHRSKLRDKLVTCWHQILRMIGKPTHCTLRVPGTTRYSYCTETSCLFLLFILEGSLLTAPVSGNQLTFINRPEHGTRISYGFGCI